jgi:penicillin-binding protein 1A
VFAAEFFAEDVRRLLIDLYGEDKLYGGGLSVRSTLDPKLQRYAKKVLVDGLVGFDRSKGWRGVVGQLEATGEDWGADLAKIPVWNDIEPWRLAVVLEVTDKAARIGLRPRKQANGEVETTREEGVLAAEDARWAMKGGKKGKLTSILNVGDLIYVSPLEDKEARWELQQIPELEGAIVVMDPHTGRVLALVGGFSFDEGQFDRVTQAKRQPGSAFKPFVYATALDNGYTPSTVILDAPIAIEQGGGQGAWKPENYSGKFYGPSTLRTGIEFSRNLMTVRLAQDVGMPLIAEYARRFGVYDNMMPVLSMSLGAGETTLLRMATGYSIIANGGRKVYPTLIDRIQDRRGQTIWRHDTRECLGCNVAQWNGGEEPELPDDRKQVIDPHTAYQITSMMEGVVQRGTATRLKEVGIPIAGKTGTTNDAKDVWFMGYTPDLVVGVYLGFDQPKSLGDSSTGGQLAAPIVGNFLKLAQGDKPAVPFRVPPGIKLVRINRRTGMRAASGDPDAIMEAFKPDTDPPEAFSSLGGDGYSFGSGTIGSGTGGLY